MKIGINTFGLQKLMSHDFEGTLNNLNAMGIDAIEPCVYFTSNWGAIGKEIKNRFQQTSMAGGVWPDDEADRKITIIKEKGFEIHSAHLPFTNIKDDLLVKAVPEAIAFSKKHGIPCYVINFQKTKINEMESYLPVLKEAVKTFEDNGIKILFHNHGDELIDDCGDCVFDYVLREVPNLNVELDVGWVKFAGRDCIKWIRKYRERISILHLKDITENATKENLDNCFTAIGEGSLPLKEILMNAEDLKLDDIGYIIDQDNSNGDMLHDIAVGLANIRDK